MKNVMSAYTDAVKEAVLILLIINGAGALKQVLTESGVTDEIASGLQQVSFPPLILGWLIAAFIRIAVGSATIAGLTTAGIIAAILFASNTDQNLMVLSIGAGSLVLSHVNDSGILDVQRVF